MSWLDKFKEYLKDKYYSLREGLEFTDSVDNIIKRIPIQELENNYYYDFVKNDLVPKDIIGKDVNEQSAIYLSFLNEKIDSFYKGIEFEVDINANSENNDINIDSEYFINSMYIYAYYEGTSDSYDYDFDFKIETETTFAQSIILHDSIIHDFRKSISRVYNFVHSKQFHLYLKNNNSSYTLKLRIVFFLTNSEINNNLSYEYYMIVSNTIKTFQVRNIATLFNSITISLYDTSGINADINVYAMISSGHYIEVLDITVSGIGNTYSKTFQLPANSHFYIFFKNNQTSTLEMKGNLFFSKNFDFLPIGTVLMYSGTFVNDTTLVGWYVCDGNNGTPNLTNKFIRCESTSGNTGGSDNAIVVSHRHSATTYRTVPTPSGNQPCGFYGSQNGDYKYTNYTGSSGTNANIPAYYSLIFIMKIR